MQFFIVMAQGTSGFAKQVESLYKPIKGDSVYASICECSNAQYNAFLNSFLEKEDLGNFTIYRPDSTGWNFKHFFPQTQYYNEPIAKVYSWHKSYANSPVVNVSFQKALAYCLWLTHKYNSSPGRKFKQVVFRLPDAEEWKYAARGINAPNPDSNQKRFFPWRGYSLRNAEGKFRANFAPILDENIKRDENYYLKVTPSVSFSDIGADGYMYPAPCDQSLAKSYTPNEFGLYHIAGNVSEYILEEGKTKGGSFISPGYYLLIDTDEPEFREEELGGPFIGFRPFMFVVER